MAKGIVDLLEVVEVHEEHRHRCLFLSSLGQQALGTLEKEGSIGQAGQGIVQGLMAELILEAAAFGDILRHDQHTTSTVEHQAVGGDVHVDEQAILGQVPPRARLLEILSLGREVLVQFRHILRRTDLGNRHGEEFVTRIAVVNERSLVDLDEAQGLDVVDPHRVRMTLEEHAEVLLGLPQCRLGILATSDVMGEGVESDAIRVPSAPKGEFYGKGASVAVLRNELHAPTQHGSSPVAASSARP